MAEQEADETTALGEGGRSMLAPGEAEGGAYTHGSLGRLSPACT